MLYPATAAYSTTALIPADAQGAFLYQPTITSNIPQQYSGFSPSATTAAAAAAAAALLTGNILRSTTGVTLNSSNKRKSSTIYSTKSDSKLNTSGHLRTPAIESPSRTPVNNKKSCLKLEGNPVYGTAGAEAKRVSSSTAICMAASPIRPIIGQQQSQQQQQITVPDHYHHHRANPYDQSQVAVASPATVAANSQQSYSRQHSAMDQMRQTQPPPSQAQSQQDSQQQMVPRF